MKTAHLLILTLSLLGSSITFANEMGDPSLGQTPPPFELQNELGKSVKLEQFKGKTIVLEWFNEGCPFVKKHYKSKNMQSLQEDFSKKGVIWLSIISSKKGKQGYLEPKDALSRLKDGSSKATHILMDPTGSVGKLYGAKTTPHMYIIGPDFKLAYKGGIDDKDTTDVGDIATAKPFVKTALTEILEKKKVTLAQTEPYGCSVKY